MPKRVTSYEEPSDDQNVDEKPSDEEPNAEELSRAPGADHRCAHAPMCTRAAERRGAGTRSGGSAMPAPRNAQKNNISSARSRKPQGGLGCGKSFLSLVKSAIVEG